MYEWAYLILTEEKAWRTQIWQKKSSLRKELWEYTAILKKILYVPSEHEGETKKPESYVIYVEFLLWSSKFSFTILCQEGLHWGKQVSEVYVKKCVKNDYIGTNKYQKCIWRNMSRRIMLEQTSTRSVCEEWGKQVSEVYVKKCPKNDYIGTKKYQKCMWRNVSRRIILGQTSIRSLCEEMCQEGLHWGKQVSEMYVKKCVKMDYIGTNKYQKCMWRNGKLGEENYITEKIHIWEGILNLATFVR